MRINVCTMPSKVEKIIKGSLECARSRLKLEKVSLKPEQTKYRIQIRRKEKTLVLKESEILKRKFFVGRWENNCRFLTARRKKFFGTKSPAFFTGETLN